MRAAGLVREGSGGRGDRDLFHNRLLFPILDPEGRVVAFGGRVLDDGTPKYLNSPETPLFEKGRELYGLPQARKAIQEEETVLVVEVYMDVVGLVQAGEQALADLGLDEMVVNMSFGTPHRDVLGSMERLSQHILPHLKRPTDQGAKVDA